MQTILTVVRSNRNQTSIVDDYLARFCTRLASEEQTIADSSSNLGDVAFVRDDAFRPFLENCDEEPPARLGSFGHSHDPASCRQVVFMNPIILMYRNNGQNLRLWVTSASSDADGDAESA